jgi:hypothetical protein
MMVTRLPTGILLQLAVSATSCHFRLLRADADYEVQHEADDGSDEFVPGNTAAGECRSGDCRLLGCLCLSKFKQAAMG